MPDLSFSKNGQWSYAPVTTETFAKAYADKYIVGGLMKSSDTSLFRRFEDKYIIPKSFREELSKLLVKHLKTDYPEKDTKFTTMKSVYFDSSSLDMVKHHMSKASDRFKIRTREYGPNGKLNKSDYTFLEIKAKHGDITDKFRIKVPKLDLDNFKKGIPITPTIPLAKMNSNIALPELVKRVADINQALELFHLRPSCETQYNRRAYVDGAAHDAGLRVTFDEEVEYKVLDVIPTQISNELHKGHDTEDGCALMGMVENYNPKDHMILEVKHHGAVPDWLTKFLNDNQLQKTQFSKYCYSIAKHATGK
jgi:SPX domain protein involved in polyphosphate accumulation